MTTDPDPFEEGQRAARKNIRLGRQRRTFALASALAELAQVLGKPYQLPKLPSWICRFTIAAAAHAGGDAA